MHNIILVTYGFFLILGGFMGFKKGSIVSLIAGLASGMLVFVGLWLLTFTPKVAWIFLSTLNVLLIVSFFSRFIKTKKFMPSGMMLLVAVAAVVYCLYHLSAHA